MTRDEFALLPAEKQGAIFNYQNAVTRFKRSALLCSIQTLGFVAVPQLMKVILDDQHHASPSGDKVQSFAVIVANLMTHPVTILALVTMAIAFTTFILGLRHKDIVLQREELNKLGLNYKDLAGLSNDDVTELFLLPELKKHGIRLGDEPYGEAS